MGLSKLAITLIASSIGVVAIGGAVTAVVVSRQNAQQIIDDNNHKQNPTDTNDKPQSDLPIVEKLSAQKVLDQIDQSKIVLQKNKNKTNFADLYSFEVTNKNLSIDLDKTTLGQFDSSISIQKGQNSIKDLNEGKLKIEVEIKDKNSTDKAKKFIELTGFKKGDDTLKNLLDAKGDTAQTDNTYSLSLIPSNENVTKFVSLEDLNKKEGSEMNGLTSWLKTSTLKDLAKDVVIEGKVKVSKITKDTNNKTFFVLVSADENSYIKLIDKSKNQNKQILVGQIKTTNLLATDLTAYVIDENQDKSKQFLDELKKIQTKDKKYLQNNANASLNRTISIKVPKTDSNQSPKLTSEVFVKPYVMDVNKSDESQTIKLGLKINFGKDEYKTTFDTQNETHTKLLSEANMSFHLYALKIDGQTEMKIEADVLTNSNKKLDTYFNDSNYKAPFKKPTIKDNGMDNKSENNGYMVYGPFSSDLKDKISFKTEKLTTNENWIIFADYSYTTQTETNQLEQKVLFTPSISLIHLDKKQEK